MIVLCCCHPVRFLCYPTAWPSSLDWQGGCMNASGGRLKEQCVDFQLRTCAATPLAKSHPRIHSISERPAWLVLQKCLFAGRGYLAFDEKAPGGAALSVGTAGPCHAVAASAAPRRCQNRALAWQLMKGKTHFEPRAVCSVTPVKHEEAPNSYLLNAASRR